MQMQPTVWFPYREFKLWSSRRWSSTQTSWCPTELLLNQLDELSLDLKQHKRGCRQSETLSRTRFTTWTLLLMAKVRGQHVICRWDLTKWVYSDLNIFHDLTPPMLTCGLIVTPSDTFWWLQQPAANKLYNCDILLDIRDLILKNASIFTFWNLAGTQKQTTEVEDTRKAKKNT